MNYFDKNDKVPGEELRSNEGSHPQSDMLIFSSIFFRLIHKLTTVLLYILLTIDISSYLPMKHLTEFSAFQEAKI